jgi:hypothetical protein
MAAGLGFKTFNTGDVLTSADTNGYLMQGVLVFANAAARTAAIASPQEGQTSYLKDTDAIQVYSGSAWVTKSGAASPLTTKGDLYGYSTTDARVPIGANNTVLTADSAEATGVKWATVAAGPTNYTLLNAGGTALTGAATITISSISAKELLVLVAGASSASAGSFIYMRINGDSTNNYSNFGIDNSVNTSYAATGLSSIGGYSNQSLIYLGTMANTASANVNASCFVDLADQTGWKRFSAVGSGNAYTGGNDWGQYVVQGFYEGSAAITSISIISQTGNFDAGTVYVLGAN